MQAKPASINHKFPAANTAAQTKSNRRAVVKKPAAKPAPTSELPKSAAEPQPKPAPMPESAASKNLKEREDVKIQANLATHVGAAYDLTEESLRDCLADFLPTASRSEMLAMCQALGGVEETDELSVANFTRKLAELDKNKHWLVMSAIIAIANNGGTLTPAEELITNLLTTYKINRFDPETVEMWMDSFLSDYERMTASSATFVRNHPALFKDLCI